MTTDRYDQVMYKCVIRHEEHIARWSKNKEEVVKNQDTLSFKCEDETARLRFLRIEVNDALEAFEREAPWSSAQASALGHYEAMVHEAKRCQARVQLLSRQMEECERFLENFEDIMDYTWRKEVVAIVQNTTRVFPRWFRRDRRGAHLFVCYGAYRGQYGHVMRQVMEDAIMAICDRFSYTVEHPPDEEELEEQRRFEAAFAAYEASIAEMEVRFAEAAPRMAPLIIVDEDVPPSPEMMRRASGEFNEFHVAWGSSSEQGSISVESMYSVEEPVDDDDEFESVSSFGPTDSDDTASTWSVSDDSSIEEQARDYGASGVVEGITNFVSNGQDGKLHLALMGLILMIGAKIPTAFESSKEQICKMVESIALLCINLKQCSSFTHMATTLYAFVASNLEQGIAANVIRLISEQFAQPEEQSMEQLKVIFQRWASVRSSPLYTKVARLIALLVAAGVCQAASLPFGVENFDKFYKTSGVADLHSVDIVTQICDTCIFIYDRAMHFFDERSFSSLFGMDAAFYEEEYALLVSKLPLLDAGQLHTADMTREDYLIRLDSLITTTKLKLRGETGIARKILTDKLLTLQKCDTKSKACIRKEPQREKPFAVLLEGKSSVGKSTLVNLLAHHLRQAMGLPVSAEGHVSINGNDKYQSEIRSHHNTYVLDDVANSQPQHTDINPTQFIIDCINNNPRFALMPEADLKGQVSLLPKIVIATTNLKDLNSHVYSVEPISILRRFDVHVNVSVRPEFCRDGSYMIDSSKVPSGLADIWNFTASYVVPVERTTGRSGHRHVPFVFEEAPMENVRLDTFLRFMAVRAREHQLQQKKYMQECRALEERVMCEHDSFVGLCTRCPVIEEQSKIVWDTVVEGAALVSSHCYDVSYHFPFDFAKTRPGRWVCAAMWRRWGKPQVKHCARTAAMCVIPYIVCLPFFPVITIIFATTTFLLLFLGLMKNVADVWFDKLRLAPFREQTRAAYLAVKERKFAAIAACVVVVGAVAAYYKMYAHAFMQEQGSVVVTPTPDPVPREEVWAKVELEEVRVAHELSTMTFDQSVSVVKTCVAHADFKRADGTGVRSNIFALQGCLWLCNWHTLGNPLGFDHIVVTRVSPGTVGPNFTVQFGRCIVHRIGKTDLGLISMPAGGSLRDMMPFFPDGPLVRGEPARMVTREVSGGISFDDVYCSLHRVVFGDNDYRGLSYTTTANTYNGLCMSPLVSRGKTNYIMGFHSAGVADTTRGYGHQVSRVELQHAIDEMHAVPSSIIMQCASMDEVRLADPEWGVALTGSVHPKSPLCFLESGTVFAYGAHTGTRRKFRSGVVTSPISLGIQDFFGVAIGHGPPVGMDSWVPWHTDINATTTSSSLKPDILQMAFCDFKDTLDEYLSLNPGDLTRIHPIDNVTILSGADDVYGVDSIKLQTSAGWPYNFPKTKIVWAAAEPTPSCQRPLEAEPWVWDKVAEAEECFASGQRYTLIHRATLKDEPTKLGKDKVRVFAGTSIICLCLVRKYFLTLSKFVMEHPILFECAVGVNATGSDWTHLTKAMIKFGEDRMVAGDYKKFDKQMEALISMSAFQLLIHIAKCAGYTERQLRIMRGIATELCLPIYEFNGEFIGTNSSNPSGHSLTVIINNLVNSLYQRYAFYDLSGGNPPERFNKCVSLICYGDDNKMSVREDCGFFNHTSIASSLARCGITYTMADKEAESVPYISNSQCSFLKRSSVWSDKYQQYMGPIEEASIYKMLHCFVKSEVLTPQQQAADCMHNALREWFHYGEETFRDRYQKMCGVAIRYDLLSHFPGNQLVTFEQLDCEYREKYCTGDVPSFFTQSPHQARGGPA